MRLVMTDRAFFDLTDFFDYDVCQAERAEAVEVDVRGRGSQVDEDDAAAVGVIDARVDQ